MIFRGFSSNVKFQKLFAYNLLNDSIKSYSGLFFAGYEEDKEHKLDLLINSATKHFMYKFIKEYKEYFKLKIQFGKAQEAKQIEELREKLSKAVSNIYNINKEFKQYLKSFSEEHGIPAEKHKFSYKSIPRLISPCFNIPFDIESKSGIIYDTSEEGDNLVFVFYKYNTASSYYQEKTANTQEMFLHKFVVLLDIFRDINEHVKEKSETLSKFLNEIAKLDKMLDHYLSYEDARNIYNFLYYKILSIISVDVNIDTTDNTIALDVSNKNTILNHDIILSKISIGDKINTVQDILNYLNNNEINIKYLNKELNIDLEFLISCIYPQANQSRSWSGKRKNNGTIIQEIETAIKEYLEACKSSSSTVLQPIYQYASEENITFEKITYETGIIIPFILYEKYSKGQKNGEQLLKFLESNYQYLKNKDIHIYLKRVPNKHAFLIPIESMFPDYIVLKDIEANTENRNITYDEEQSIIFYSFLMQVVSFITAVQSIVIDGSKQFINNYKDLVEKYNLKSNTSPIFPVIYALINRNHNNKVIEQYKFWDVVRNIAKQLNFSLQTINPDKTIDKLNQEATFKNMMFSAVQPNYKMHITTNKYFPHTTVYLLIEHAPNENSDVKTYFYEAFVLNYYDNKVNIHRYVRPNSLPKNFYLFPDEDILKDELQEILQKDENDTQSENIYKFIVVEDKNSPIIEHIKRNQYNKCYFIYNQQILFPSIKTDLSNNSERFTYSISKYKDESWFSFNALSIQEYKQLNSYFTFRTILPNFTMKNDLQIINLTLPVFYTDPAMNYEIFNIAKNSILFWLKYQTEKYDFAISKPSSLNKVLPKGFIRLNINKKITTYFFDTFALSCELCYVADKWFLSSVIKY